MSCDFTKSSNGNNYKNIYGVHMYQGILYIMYYDLVATEYGVDQVDLKVNATSGAGIHIGGGVSHTSTIYMITRYFDGGKQLRDLDKGIL